MYAFETYRTRRYTSTLFGATCCNIMALALALFAVFSPYYLWGSSFFQGTTTTLATGPWVAAATSTTFDCGFFCVGVIQAQWLYWGEISSADACTNRTNIFNEWSGRYGFCDKIDGDFSKTTEIRVVQAFTILTVIFVVLATIAGCLVQIGGGRSMCVAGVSSLLTMVFAIVAFSTVISYKWYDDLLKGTGSLPFYDADGKLIAVTNVNLHYGPSFITMIFVFILTFFSSLSYFYAARGVERELSPQDTRNTPTEVYAEELDGK